MTLGNTFHVEADDGELLNAIQAAAFGALDTGQDYSVVVHHWLEDSPPVRLTISPELAPDQAGLL